MKPKSRPIPLSLPLELLGRIDEVAAQMNRKRAQLIRDAIEVGLEYFRRCEYNLAAAVIDRGDKMKGLTEMPKEEEPPQLPKAAESGERTNQPRRGKTVYRKRGPKKS